MTGREVRDTTRAAIPPPTARWRRPRVAAAGLAALAVLAGCTRLSYAPAPLRSLRSLDILLPASVAPSARYVAVTVKGVAGDEPTPFAGDPNRVHRRVMRGSLFLAPQPNGSPVAVATGVPAAAVEAAAPDGSVVAWFPTDGLGIAGPGSYPVCVTAWQEVEWDENDLGGAGEDLPRDWYRGCATLSVRADAPAPGAPSLVLSGAVDADGDGVFHGREALGADGRAATVRFTLRNDSGVARSFGSFDDLLDVERKGKAMALDCDEGRTLDFTVAPQATKQCTFSVAYAGHVLTSVRTKVAGVNESNNFATLTLNADVVIDPAPAPAPAPTTTAPPPTSAPPTSAPPTGGAGTWVDACAAGCGTPPSARRDAVLAKFTVSGPNQGMVLFGGTTDGATLLNDTYRFDGQWTLLDDGLGPESHPSPRSQSAAVFDPSANRIILFGGRTGTSTVVNDTWAFDGSSWTQLLSPADCAAHAGWCPSARRNHMLAVNPGGGLVLSGGYDGTGYLDDTWTWSNADGHWTQRTPATKPDARHSAAMVFEGSANRVVLFGGSTACGTGCFAVTNDTWEWNGSTWSQADAGGAPSASRPAQRFDASLAYSSIDDAPVLVGGSGTLVPSGGDAWVFHPASHTWTALPTTGLPPSRSAAVLESGVGAVTGTDLVLFGGLGSSSLGDTWKRLP